MYVRYFRSDDSMYHKKYKCPEAWSLHSLEVVLNSTVANLLQCFRLRCVDDSSNEETLQLHT
jgi:hypothetical protein